MHAKGRICLNSNIVYCN